MIEQQGDTVLVSESLDTGTTETLEKEIFATATRNKSCRDVTCYVSAYSGTKGC